jgi:hypothetical protein
MVSSPRDSKHKNQPKNVLPSRLLDYFAIVEPKELLKPPESLSNLHKLDFESMMSSVYPSKAIDKDNPIPDLISQFVYPNGIHLSREEKQPTFFTFVLTNSNGIKLYG